MPGDVQNLTMPWGLTTTEFACGQKEFSDTFFYCDSQV